MLIYVLIDLLYKTKQVNVKAA